MQGLCPELGRQKKWLLHQDNTPLFTKEFFTKHMTNFPPPTLLTTLGPLQLFCFPSEDITMFHTTVVIEG
jgi:hypothetical protein